MRQRLTTHGVPSRAAGLLVVAAFAVLASACGSTEPVLTDLMDARRLTGELQAAFSRASEASSRAVLADTDDVSAAAAKDAAASRAVVVERLASLDAVIAALGYSAETGMLSTFKSRFEEYQKLDSEILELAVENTNLKAQRLTFGAQREMADAINTELLQGGGAAATDVDAQAVRADLFELLFIEARHNAEADEAAMTQMEQRATAVAADAQQRLARLARVLTGPAVPAAASLFERFMATHDEAIALSRRNTNVRSLALTFGRARVVAAECADAMQALQDSLATHGSEATR